MTDFGCACSSCLVCLPLGNSSLVLWTIVSLYYLTVPPITPPQPDHVVFGGPFWTGHIVMDTLFVHRQVNGRVERDEGEVGQVDLVDRIEDVLPLRWIGRPLLLQE